MGNHSKSFVFPHFLFFFSSSCLLHLILFLHGSEAYENYTVGGSLGWYDSLKVPKVDYQNWAKGKDFSLGDFLIFNTDKNHSVVQTYNETTYKRCDYADADAEDTTEWSAGEPTFDDSPVTVLVPLLRVGPTFYFSVNYDGEQCRYGQHFVINVTHGQGLPPSLNDSPGSPAPASSDAGGEEVPDTVVPSNFNDPTDNGGGDHMKAMSAAGRDMANRLVVAGFVCMLVMFGIVLG